jgi:putative transposase
MNEKYPYLLKGLAILRPNHVWGSDITYIRTAHGFVYLVAFIDWFSRYVVAWRLADSMELDFCLEALDEALVMAIPEISNTDQGSHFTAGAFLDRLRDKEVVKLRFSATPCLASFSQLFLFQSASRPIHSVG